MPRRSHTPLHIPKPWEIEEIGEERSPVQAGEPQPVTRGKWRYYILINGQPEWSGPFYSSEEEAHAAMVKAVAGRRVMRTKITPWEKLKLPTRK